MPKTHVLENSLPCRIRSRRLKCPPSDSENAVVCHHPRCRLADLLPPRRVGHRSSAHHRKVHDSTQGKDRSGRPAGEGARCIPEARSERGDARKALAGFSARPGTGFGSSQLQEFARRHEGRDRGGRQRSGTRTGALFDNARDYRHDQPADGLVRHRRRHDRDLRLAIAHRIQPPGTGPRHFRGAVQHGIRSGDRHSSHDFLPPLSRQGRRFRGRDGATGSEAGRRGPRRTLRIPAAAAYSGMRFARTQKEDPEINLIPMIDVLLVIIIFLMLTTTYSRFAELKINLPSADAERKPERANEINVVISANGQYVLQRKPVQFRDVASLAEELRRAGTGMKDAIVVVNADNNANYQSVIRVMDAARQAGYGQVVFAVEQTTK